MRETPTILDAGHAHTTYGLGNLGAATSTVASNMVVGSLHQLGNNNMGSPLSTYSNWTPGLQQQAAHFDAFPALAVTRQHQKEAQMDKPTRRLVQVIIADVDDNVPLDNTLLYSGSQKLTDLTDQELFFEIDIKTILTDHNAKRVTFINKKVKERTEYLEPARIRDLKMVVVTVAGF